MRNITSKIHLTPNDSFQNLSTRISALFGAPDHKEDHTQSKIKVWNIDTFSRLELSSYGDRLSLKTISCRQER